MVRTLNFTESDDLVIANAPTQLSGLITVERIDQRIKILHIEDLPSDAALLNNVLKKALIDFEITVVDTKEKFIDRLDHFCPDIILCDHRLPTFDSHEALAILSRMGLKIPLILVTSSMSDELAADSIRRGADDYMIKDRLSRLPSAIKNALEKSRLRKERQLYLDELVRSERRYRALVENGTDCMVIFNEDMKPNFASSNIKQILGYTKDEILNINFWEIIHPEDRQDILLRLEDCHKLPGVSIPGYTGRVRHKNGSWRWMEATITNMLDDPAINGIVDNFRDVTERRHSELLLRESEEKYRSFFTNSPDGILLTVKDGPIYAANPAACEMFRMTEEEICKVGRLGLTDPGDPRVQLGIEERRHRGAAKVEVTLKRKDESLFEAEVSSVVFSNAAGQPQTSLIIRDLTEQKASQAELHRSQTNLQAIFENTTEGFILTDLDGRVMSYNQRAKEYIRLNTGLEILEGRRIFEFIEASRQQNYREVISRVLAGHSINYDHSYKRENGETRWFHFIINPVHDNGSVSGVCITSSDITERKTAEHQLKNSELFNKGILSSLGAHIAVLDSEGNLIAVNKAWDDFATENGSTSLERTSIGSNYFDVCRKAALAGDLVAAEALAGIQSVLKLEQQVFELEYFCQSNEGKKWFTLQVLNFGDDHTKVVLSHQNITERKKAEYKLAESEARLKEAQAVTNIGSWETDLRTEAIIWSEESYRIFEVQPDTFIPTLPAFLALVHPEERDRVEMEFRTATGENTFYTIEHRICTPRGTVKTLEERWYVFHDEDGNPARAVGTCQDITERKKHDELIILSQANLNAIIENNDAFIYSLDSEFKYITFNTALASTTKKLYGIDILPGYDVFDFIRQFEPGDEQEWLEIYRKALNGEIVKFEKDHQVAGSTVYTSYSIHPMWEHDTVIGVTGFVQDITLRKAAEEEQRQRDLRYRQIVETSQEGIWVLDENSRTIFANRKMCEILEYPEEELLGKDKTFFLDESGRQSWALEFQRRKEGLTGQYDCQLITRTGKIIWTSITANPIISPEGQFQGSLGMVADITEKKALEELLDKANKLARIGNYEMDLVNNSLYWSPIVKEIHEVNDDFVPDLETAVEFYNGTIYRDIITKAIAEAIRNRKPFDVELQIITAKGSERWVRAIGKAEFAHDTCTRVYGSFQDIDKLKRAEIEILKVYEEKNGILESIGDAFFAVDLEWKVTYWNKEAEKLLGRSRDSMIGANVWDVFSQDIDAEFRELYVKSLGTNTPVSFVKYYSPLAVWIEVSAYPAGSGLSVFFKDITVRIAAKEKLMELNESLQHKAKELAISNGELEHFAYVASHDLQEPLRMITSFLSLLEKKYAGIIDDKGKQYIHFAVDGAKRMRQIILDLLEYSRVGKREEDLGEVNIQTLIEGILILNKKQIEESGAVVHYDGLASVTTYKTKLQQIIQNLISNALKYQRKDVAPVIEISIADNVADWQLSVKDNGLGIESEYFERIFVIFQRLHSKEDFEGVGMGLALCKKIAESINGRIWVESEPGAGSVFHVTIPK